MDFEFNELRVSGSVQGNFKCTWNIERFSSLDSRVGKSQKSTKFQLEDRGTEWYLQIYPGGEKENSKGYVSFYVHRTITEGIKCKFNLSLRNSNGAILFEGVSNNKWIFMHSGSGYSKTLQTKDLTSQLVNDNLIVILEATYCTTYVKDNVETNRSAEITPTISCTENWRDLFTNKENTDCVISMGGEYILAHSLVLSTHSKVFAAMFKHDTIEKDTSCVTITDFEKSTMVAFVEFIYSGGVHEIDIDLALELLRASDKYEVSHLKLYCTNYLMSLLDDENACQIYASAARYNAHKLENHSLEYICENLSEEDVEAQRSVLNEHKDLLWDILKRLFKKRKMWKRVDSE